ncbi:MAG: hypothetical protein Kow0075_12790 [Salibacteraceae bacterium]
MPYSFSWNGTIDTTDTVTGTWGTYAVTVTDANGCFVSDTIYVSALSLPFVQINFPDDTVCQQGPVQLTGGFPTGGVYSGLGVQNDTLYTDSITGQILLTYTYTDTNGCVSEDSDILYVKEAPSVTLLKDTIELCGGSTHPLDFALPTGGAFYSPFIDTATGELLAPDTNYSGMGGFYVFGNGCGFDTGSFSMVIHARPVVDLGPDTSLCNAGVMLFDAGNQWSYEWYDGSSGQTHVLNSGEEPLTEDVVVWVKVMNEWGCQRVDSVYVDIKDQPVIYLGENLEVCMSEIVILSVANVYDHFIWNDSTTGSVNQVHDGGLIPPGQYKYWVTGYNDDGCSYSDTIYVRYLDCDSVFVGIDPLDRVSMQIRIYPNPTRGEITIDAGENGMDWLRSLELRDMQGRTMQSIRRQDMETYENAKLILNLRGMSNGVYELSLEGEQGRVSKRIILQK